MRKYVLIDIGGTSIKYGLIRDDDKWLDKQTIDTLAHKGANYIMNRVKEVIAEYIKHHEIVAICVSTAGVVDAQSGEILHASNAIPHYKGTKVKELIEQEFHLPCFVENDVNCAGYAELYGVHGKKSKVLVCLTIGTGIGGSLLIDKNLYHGASYFAMEVGYINIDGHEFQDIASTTSLVEEVSMKKNDGKQYDGRIIFDLAKHNDEICRNAIDNLCFNLAKGIANLCYVTNPDTVILGGGIMNEHAYLYPILNDYLKEIMIPYVYENVRLNFAYHDNDAGMLGAYRGYKNKVMR